MVGVAATVLETTGDGPLAAPDAISFTIGPPPATASNAFVDAANPSGGNAVAPGVSPRCTAPTSRRRSRYRTPRLHAALHARRRDRDDRRRVRAVVLRLADSVQFSSSVVYAHRPGIDLSDGHPGSAPDHLHGAAEALCAGALYHNQAGTGQASTLIAGTASLAAPTKHSPGRVRPESANTSRSTQPVSATCQPARSRRR